MAHKVHQHPQKYNVTIGSTFTEWEPSDNESLVTRLWMQFVCEGEEPTGGMAALSGEIPLATKEFADREQLYAWIDSIKRYFQDHLPRRVVEVAWETMIEAEANASDTLLPNRPVDKRSLREWVVKQSEKSFNRRWRMPKGSQFEYTREDLIKRVRDAIFELNAVHKWKERRKLPVQRIVAEHLRYSDTSSLRKVMRAHQIHTWNAMLHLCLWHWFAEQ